MNEHSTFILLTKLLVLSTASRLKNMKMKSQNIFSDLPHCPKNEIFDSLIKNESITIERIVSKGHRSPENGWYDQDKNEWILIIKGQAISMQILALVLACHISDETSQLYLRYQQSFVYPYKTGGK